MTEPLHEIIIHGATTAGKTFRPSDWAERLSGVMSILGEDNRLNYSPFVKPMTIDGVRCVVIGKQLETLDARAFRFLLGFARDNDLRVSEHIQE